MAEFKIGLKEMGIRLTEIQMEALIDELDADGSGTIDYAELKAKLLVDSDAASAAAAAAAAATLSKLSVTSAEGASILRLSTSAAAGEKGGVKKSVRLATPASRGGSGAGSGGGGGGKSTPTKSTLKSKNSSLSKATSPASTETKDKKKTLKKKSSSLKAK